MRARPLLLALAASLAITACGPSLRRVHRASAYFEQCYAADLDPEVLDAERRACWQAWSHAYLIGASPERLDYVHERLAMLDPDRAAVIALATGDDGSVETIDPSDTTETIAEEIVVAVEVAPEAAVEASAEPPAPRTPTASEVAPPDTTAQRLHREERHALGRQRHLHRGFVAPSTLTPSCPCHQVWSGCSSSCLADDAGCISACRREFTLCSRSCY